MSNPISRRAVIGGLLGAAVAGAVPLEAHRHKPPKIRKVKDGWTLLISEDGETSVGDTYIGPRAQANALKAAQQLNDADMWVTVQPTLVKAVK